MANIAAILTCHNRVSQTLACLEALFRNQLPEGYSLEVFLVDDGSNDGTSDAVKQQLPEVHLIEGDGNLYWNGGMRVAFAAAMQRGFDYYLWLNDDTLLYPYALSTLLVTEEEFENKQGKSAVIVGSTQAEPGSAVTYGGQVRISHWIPNKYQLVTPTDIAITCDTMNGNCVLIPCGIAKEVGNLDVAFVHAMGDTDYGLRTWNAGFQVVVMPGYAGQCERNSVVNTFADTRLGVQERFKKILGKKGLPFRAWYVFTKRHCGILWVIFWLWPYFRLAISSAIRARK